MIRYSHSLDGVTPEHLTGFFVGWPAPPSPATHLRILHASHAVVLAVDDQAAQVVGYVTALTDGILSAYIPLLEVLPAYQGRGIGSQLVGRMLGYLGELYMVDLVCDPDLEPFYSRLGLARSHAMSTRRYDRQAGR
jgi:ribosomal protein S18 acetylase RimI-like enzyme